jgi:diguanylate cyclase (GGDEF)-like protein
MARRAVDAGANDYLIHPPTGEELDAALGIPATVTAAPSPSTGAMIAPEELDAVGLMLSQVDDATGALLDTLARHLRQGLRAGGVRVTADRTTGQAGTTQGTPPLIEPLQRDAAAIGQVELWPTQAASFTPADAEKLRHYARLTERILDLAARQRQWRRLAMTDDLTGLPNRRYLYARLDELLARAAEQRRRVTFMLFDIDNFKGYNDRYGHPVGDQIIRETGQLFRQCCRKHDVVTRMGGDEFGVVFWDADEPRVAGSKHPESPLDVLHRFKAALGQHQFPALGADAQGTLTVSAGLAGYPWDARTRDELIERADQALLEAKRQGKNRIHLVGE